MPYTMIERDTCEVCASNLHAILISKHFTDPSVFYFIDQYYEFRIKKEDLEGFLYEVVRCNECSFIWQKYILDDTGMNKLYSDWISKEHSLAKKEQAGVDLFVRYSAEVQEIAVLLDKKPCEINVLDYGMGWGFWCLMAKAHGFNVYGYELSEDRVEYAEKLGIDVMKSIDDKQHLRFDFINSHHVFEHISQPVVLLKKLSHLLRDNGIIKISVPNGNTVKGEDFANKWKAKKDALHPLEHINCFNSQTLAQLGDASGLKPIHIEGATAYYAHEDGLMRRNLFAENQQTIKETDNYREELLALKNSYSYKLGRFITYPFRYRKDTLKV